MSVFRYILVILLMIGFTLAIPSSSALAVDESNLYHISADGHTYTYNNFCNGSCEGMQLQLRNLENDPFAVSVSSICIDNYCEFTFTENLSEIYQQVGRICALWADNSINGCSSTFNFIFDGESTNTPPSVSSITATTNPVQVDTLISTSATITDPDITDAHSGIWNWNDGTTSPAQIEIINGVKTATGTHIYTTAGVYEVNLTVTDNSNAEGSAQPYRYISVFDTSGGSVSGSKEFISPSGAVYDNSNATGKASFAFQVKYHKKDVIPSGKKVEFSFPAGDLKFISTQYLWLVVNGPQAIFKANGALNGVPGYDILISAVDQGTGHQNGLIRIQIKHGTSVIYDTQQGALDTASPTTQVSKGKIKIQ